MSTYVDHVTFHVPHGTLASGETGYGVDDFWDMLGLAEIEPQETPFAGKVRWFALRSQLREETDLPLVHLIEASPPRPYSDYGAHDQIVLGHICIATQRAHFEFIREEAAIKHWLERDSGSGRIWVRYANIRVEVRPDDGA